MNTMTPCYVYVVYYYDLMFMCYVCVSCVTFCVCLACVWRALRSVCFLGLGWFGNLASFSFFLFWGVFGLAWVNIYQFDFLSF